MSMIGVGSNGFCFRERGRRLWMSMEGRVLSFGRGIKAIPYVFFQDELG